MCTSTLIHETKKPFYVGKGQARIVLSHLSPRRNPEDTDPQGIGQTRIAATHRNSPHALPSEEAALRIEAAVIDLCGLDKLANLVSGWRSIQLGKISLKELIYYYAAEPVRVVDAVVLIRINRLYRHGMSEEELYDATRSCWKLSSRRERAKYAFSVFEGVVREVYAIDAWHKGGTTPCKTRIHTNPRYEGGRREFTGRVAEESVRSRYFGGSVAAYFPRGLCAPVKYVNV